LGLLGDEKHLVTHCHGTAQVTHGPRIFAVHIILSIIFFEYSSA